jgi:hypothetical protein
MEKKINQPTSQRRHIGLKFVLIIVCILALTGVVIISILRDKIVNSNNNQVSVTGRGEITYQPDVASVILGVQIDKSAKAEEALISLNEKVNKISATLNSLGITDIKTQNYSLYPYYDYIDGINVLSGYNANQQIMVKVYDIDKNIELLNQVVSKSTEAGANQILGITFEGSNIEDLKQQARILAVTDAKKKAEALSTSIGVSLGEIVGWWDNTVSPSYNYSYGVGGMGGSESGGANVSAGTYKVIVELSLNYKIKK